MKTAILTFQQAINYGAILQLFALQKTIESFNEDVIVVNYISKKLESDYKNLKFNKGFKIFLSSVFTFIPFIIRKNNFEKFKKDKLKLSIALHNKRELMEFAKDYDYFIVGSDQIWNYSITNNDSTYMLDFVDGDKKIAYAASFGISEIPICLNEWYKNLLKDFKNISVREKQGNKIIKDLCGIEVPVVLDPTLLLNKQEWSLLAKIENVKRGYILVYCIKKSKYIEKMSKFLIKQKNLEVIVLNPRTKDIYNKSSNSVAGPEDFVELFLNAEYVLTNSFHGTAFSINFNKKFLCELDSKPHNVNSRLESLLDLLNLQDRIIKKENDLEKINDEIDYKRVNNILEIERKKSLGYLKTSLGINE